MVSQAPSDTTRGLPELCRALLLLPVVKQGATLYMTSGSSNSLWTYLSARLLLAIENHSLERIPAPPSWDYGNRFVTNPLVAFATSPRFSMVHQWQTQSPSYQNRATDLLCLEFQSNLFLPVESPVQPKKKKGTFTTYFSFGMFLSSSHWTFEATVLYQLHSA